MMVASHGMAPPSALTTVIVAGLIPTAPHIGGPLSMGAVPLSCGPSALSKASPLSGPPSLDAAWDVAPPHATSAADTIAREETVANPRNHAPVG